MKIKQIASIAIIAALPFTANANFEMGNYDIHYVTSPASVETNGIATLVDDDAPYATAELTADDETHIATTAYVKGAYNDAIAAINAVGEVAEFSLSRLDSKRVKIYTTWGNDTNAATTLVEFATAQQ